MSILTYQEIYLNPGEFYFGEGHLRLSTLLGSCVSITLWHPLRRHGGMCHFMLDSRGVFMDHLDGKYADEAMALFMHELDERNTHPAEYEVKIFGGGKMFNTKQNANDPQDIGSRNVEAADMLLHRHEFNEAKTRHVGGSGHRRLLFDLWNGDVWVKYRTVSGAPAGQRSSDVRRP